MLQLQHLQLRQQLHLGGQVPQLVVPKLHHAQLQQLANSWRDGGQPVVGGMELLQTALAEQLQGSQAGSTSEQSPGGRTGRGCQCELRRRIACHAHALHGLTSCGSSSRSWPSHRTTASPESQCCGRKQQSNEGQTRSATAKTNNFAGVLVRFTLFVLRLGLVFAPSGVADRGFGVGTAGSRPYSMPASNMFGCFVLRWCWEGCGCRGEGGNEGGRFARGDLGRCGQTL